MTDQFEAFPGTDGLGSAGAPRPQIPNEPWVTGTLDTPAGPVARVATSTGWAERIGRWRVRWGIRRMHYDVPPGIYAVGTPTAKSQVFVSANYKASFDILRSQLDGTDGWILVLDTKGINVWCAAGKGTFGTDEIIGRVFSTRLSEIVSHRRLIVPQLGGPGVAGHKVKDATGFRVVFGPVRAVDIRPFLENNLKPTPQMRKVDFPIGERVALIPFELVSNFKYAALLAVILGGLMFLESGSISIERLASLGPQVAAVPFLALLVGTVVPPALLPILPGRGFALKGVWPGLVVSVLIWHYGVETIGILGVLGLAAIAFAGITYLSMNFTGCSTYTSLSGVQKEMKSWLPTQIVGAALGLITFVISRFV